MPKLGRNNCSLAAHTYVHLDVLTSDGKALDMVHDIRALYVYIVHLCIHTRRN